jgi:hypothetical protein
MDIFLLPFIFSVQAAVFFLFLLQGVGTRQILFNQSNLCFCFFFRLFKSFNGYISLFGHTFQAIQDISGGLYLAGSSLCQ